MILSFHFLLSAQTPLNFSMGGRFCLLSLLWHHLCAHLVDGADMVGDEGSSAGIYMNIMVLDRCETSNHDRHSGPHRVADHLGLTMVAATQLQRFKLGEEPAEAYIFVIDKPDDAPAIQPALVQFPIAAVVAWRLPETVTIDLMNQRVPVFCGLPDLDTWEQVVSIGVTDDEWSSRRQVASQLALFESQLTQRVTPGSNDGHDA